MIEQVYNDLKIEFENKTHNRSLFEEFIHKYIIEAIEDKDLLEVLNKHNRDVSNITIIDYFGNKKVLERAIKINTLLENSKDFIEFKKLASKIKSEKDINTVEFDKVLSEILKTKKE